MAIHGSTRGDERRCRVDRGADWVRAMVLAENEPGNEFYRRFGFELDEISETRIGEGTCRENGYTHE